jgi:PAS domain-containing protein
VSTGQGVTDRPQELTASGLDAETVLQACWRLTSAGDLNQVAQQLLETALQLTEATYAVLILASSSPEPRARIVWVQHAHDKAPATLMTADLQLRSFPLSWLKQSQPAPKTFCAHHPHDSDPYWRDHHPSAVIGLSFPVNSGMLGFVYLEQEQSSQGFTQEQQNLLKWMLTYTGTRLQQLQQQSDLESQLRDLDNRLRTTQTQLEQALQESEQAITNHLLVIQQLADHVPALIAYLDRNERYRFANKHYEDGW